MPENQSWGEIITKESAEHQFGSVSVSVSIGSDQLQSLAGQTTNLMMFNIKDGKLFILGDNRTVLYPQGSQVPDSEVFRVYSKTKVLELINTGGAQINSVEFRGVTLMITNSDSTLEFGTLCPPWCSQ